LLRQAQIALKQAKRGGEISFYEPTASAGLYQRFGRETALRRAIEQGELDLAFQPLVAMHDRRIVGFEALARWTHAGRPVPPGEFVPIAEDSGLIIPMGRLVLHRAMEMLGEWDERAGFIIPAYVSVNVSPLQFERDDVAAVLADASARTGVSASRMVIEITESCVVRRPDQADVVLRAITEQGARIAMDDFGTGYSNIASLQRLPIDTLKIDRSLVAGIDSSMDSLAIVRTIQRLAEALNIRTIAEGIETETVAQKVSAIGCDVGQGYLFARPQTGDAAFEAWQRGAAR
jgi:EAL domain-containing protein (putative c-di-GMP-specific phosphodiesterase class I)